MLALDNLNNEPGAPADVVVAIIFADDGDVLLLPGDGPICAITLCCEMSVAAKRENITAAAIVSIDDFSNRVCLFFVLLEVINLIAMRLY
jgi:hypothetical protein